MSAPKPIGIPGDELARISEDVQLLKCHVDQAASVIWLLADALAEADDAFELSALVNFTTHRMEKQAAASVDRIVKAIHQNYLAGQRAGVAVTGRGDR